MWGFRVWSNWLYGLGIQGLGLGVSVLIIVVQVLGKHMTIEGLDP